MVAAAAAAAAAANKYGGGDDNPFADGGVDTVSPGDAGALTPGSTFDASDVERYNSASAASAASAASSAAAQQQQQLLMQQVAQGLFGGRRAGETERLVRLATH